MITGIKSMLASSANRGGEVFELNVHQRHASRSLKFDLRQALAVSASEPSASMLPSKLSRRNAACH